MLTYNKLGQNGRLGNQMFQYAALLGTAFIRGRKFMIVDSGHSLLDTFELGSQEKYDKKHRPNFIYHESSFLYDPNINLIADNTEIMGYFQSPNYFIHCEDEVRKNFIFKKEIKQEAEIELKKLAVPNRPTCSVHIRRTDYIDKSNYHASGDMDYLQNAVKMVNENIPGCTFIVFSDDIPWCKQHLNGDVSFSENTPEVDMCMMSMCPIHIIANSSFSWWAAWLSESQAVIAPKKWFGPDGPKDWSTVYYPTWVQV